MCLCWFSHYIRIWADLELCLEFFPMWSELLPLHTTYTLVSYTCSFEPILSLILSLFHWNLSYLMQKKNIHKHMCAFVGALHHYIGIWAHLELCLENFQCDLSCCLYMLHIPWCILMSYLCLSELHFELQFELSPIEFDLSHAKKKTKHTRSLVEVLHHYIGIWAHFELCLGLSPMWFELLPLHTTYTLMHLDVLYVFVWAHFELDFEVSPLEFELSHAEKNIHKHMCTFVGVLHHYIGIWAHFKLCLELFPMWFELLPLHTTYTLMHLDVLNVVVWALFELSPLEFELSHAKNDINIRVAWLKFFITTSIFELILSSVLCFFQCDLSCYLYILHIPWCPTRVRWSPFWAWFWVFPQWNLSYPMHKKNIHNKKTLNTCVPLLAFFITTSVFELTLSSVLGFFQCDLSCCLYILHIPCILMSYMCLFEIMCSLILSFPHRNLSYPIHNKTYTNICVPLLVFFITTSVFELTLSSVLSFFQCDLSCCLYILHIPWCILMSYMCLFELPFELSPMEPLSRTPFSILFTIFHISDEAWHTWVY